VSGDGVDQTAVDVVTLSGAGALLRTHRATPPRSERSTTAWLHVHDPLGGSALVHAGAVQGPQGPRSCSGSVQRYDASGAPRGAPGTFGMGDGTCAPIAAAVSSGGEALVVEPFAGEAWLWWLNADGSLARPAVPAGDLGGERGVFRGERPVALRPLLDGSVVASERGVWTRRFPHLGDHAEDAPGWLTSRPGFTFENTRGARGYALLPPPLAQSADCSQRVELLDPSGRLCARVTLAGDGGSCTTSLVGQGWDGTVVQQQPRDHCAWRFWPRLLAGD
jgi:hypothetical protein